MGGIGHVLTKAYGYAIRGLNVYAPTVFGNGTEVMGKAYKDALSTKNPFKVQFYKDIWTGTKNAGKAAEKLAAAEKAAHGNFLKSSWNSIRTLPSQVAQGWRAESKAAVKAGNNSFLGGTKGAFKALGKRMPLIGSLMILGFELPNIVKATANEGIVQGAAETVKAGARLAGGTVGAAIGQALIPIPFVGGLAGWIAGETLAGKLVGKSYSERKEEETLALAQTQQDIPQDVQQTAPVGQTAVATNPMANTNYIQQMMLYQQMMNGNKMDDDFMTKAYINSLKANQPQLNIQA